MARAQSSVFDSTFPDAKVSRVFATRAFCSLRFMPIAVVDASRAEPSRSPVSSLQYMDDSVRRQQNNTLQEKMETEKEVAIHSLLYR